ncbi:MotE family protein [Helicobacter sp.]|uniref:MotE family protein n=1 Tax=Helicobacter sp. TaxID=218 RepID=UPI0019A522E9|nr:MotE family protein [Helicobacter sp.]MBD5165007.1 MotE family protein [Helicobacter sp.]
MKQWILYILILGILPIGATEKRGVIDCNIIFEQRKAEILQEIERIDEQQQALQALQSATQNVLDQKEADLKKREIALNEAQKEIEEREAKITRLLKRNEEVLKQIRGATQSKVGETYAGMKDSKSAAILETLPDAEAAEILFALDTKVMSKILAKMTPQKAATLTQLLQKGPPFEEEKESQQTPANTIPQNGENAI